MRYHSTNTDYGTGHKKLSVYMIGMVNCVVLTLLAFWAVMSGQLEKWQILLVIFSAAVIQFFVQVIFFLRLNLRTVQSKINVMVFLFTGIILFLIVAGSLWIMWNLDYNMMH